MDAACRLAVGGLRDGPLALGGDVVHEHLIQRHAGVIAHGGGFKGIVGVAAGPQEVVGDDGVGLCGVKGRAAHTLDGHAVDGIGLAVGRTGVVLCAAELGPGVHGVLDAGHLGEGPDGLRQAARGGLQGFQQLGTGELHQIQGVAEGQDGVDVFLGQAAHGQRGPDAAAVADGGVNFLAQGPGLPEHGVGDEVAQIGLAGADLGFFTVELHFALGEDRAVIGVDLLLDAPDDGGGIGVLGSERVQRHVGGGDGAVGGDVHHADVGQLGPGGGQVGIADFTGAVGGGLDLVQGGVGVAVNEHVDTGHSVQHVDGAVAGGLGVNAQVPQADDVVTAGGFQGIHFGLGQLHHVLAANEGHTLDLGGVGLGGGLRSCQAEETDGFVAQKVVVENDTAAESRFTVVQDIGSQGVGPGLALQLFQVVIAIVKLMVAGDEIIIASRVHDLNGCLALRGADGGIALDEVAGVYEQSIRSGSVIAFSQGVDFSVPGDAAVYVIGVQDDDVAGQVLRRGGGRLRRADGDRQGEEQGQGKREGKKLVS